MAIDTGQDGQDSKQPPRRRSVRKALLWFAAIMGGLLLILFIASFFVDEPLRRSMEKRMNSHLKGYTVKLPGLHLQLIGLSLTLKDLTILQNAHPQPPVAKFSLLKASIHWRSIFSGRLVAEFYLDQPKIYINLKQLRTEVASKTPVKERGWQQAVQEIYPLKINNLILHDGSITYIDEDPKRPLTLTKINLEAENLRNVRYQEKVYPSSFHLDADIFGKGRGIVDGDADFLAEPFPGINAQFTLKSVPLDYFRPVIARENLAIKDGTLAGNGRIEYAPKVKTAHVKELTVDGLKIDYHHATATAAAEKRRSAKVKKAAGKVSNKQGLLLRLDRLKLTNCTMGMVNKAVTPPYRVFMSDTTVILSNLSNQFKEGPATAQVTGLFMGSGKTTATAHFRPEKKGPDFDLHVRIVDTKLTAMNDILRAYGNFDVSEGYFSLFTELRIKDRAITGYLKPLFREIRVYDERKDKEKSLFHKAYELLVGGVARLLENRPRDEVATKADISGRLDRPETSTLQIVLELIRNAFFKAILPGFEREVTSQKR